MFHFEEFNEEYSEGLMNKVYKNAPELVCELFSLKLDKQSTTFLSRLKVKLEWSCVNVLKARTSGIYVRLQPLSNYGQEKISSSNV